MKIQYTISLLVSAIIILGSCNHSEKNELAHSHEHEHDEASIDEHGKHSDDEIILEPEMAERFGVKTILLQPTPMSNTIRVTGQLLSSPSDNAIISAPTTGIITLSQGITVGTTVRSGQSVARIQAKSSTGDDPNTLARASIASAKREVERLKPLLDDGIATLSEYNAALSTYEAAKAAFSHASASGNVKSPINGTITELLAVTGQFVEIGTPLARLSGNRHLILRADVPESDGSILSSINDALIMSSSNSGWTSVMSMGGKRIDRQDMPVQSGYKSVYFIFNNNNDILTVGSSVEVDLISDKRSDCLSIPVSALIEQQGENYVYVKTGDHSYQKHLVKTGIRSGDMIEIVSGLSAGQEVVSTGASVIKMAEASGSIPEGHSHNH